jgi:hypothetical protein
MFGAVTKPLHFAAVGPPTMADDFSGGTPRLGNEEFGLGRSH